MIRKYFCYQFIRFHWKVLSISFGLPILAICISIYLISFPIYIRKRSDPDWIPDHIGEIQCTYTNYTFWNSSSKYKDALYVKIWGKTVNTTCEASVPFGTICFNQTMEYVEEYWNCPICPGNRPNYTVFERDIQKKFPIGKVFNCSITKNCKTFAQP